MSKPKSKKDPAQSRTLVIWVLDETGSMLPNAAQTVSGFNEYLTTLKNKTGKFWVALTRFNATKIDVAGPRLIGETPNLTDYRPNDNTPLYDAIWEAVQAGMAWVEGQKHKPQIMVIVQTDGEENSSHSHTRLEIVDLIAKLRADGGEIMFLGVDIDLWAKEGLARAANVGTYAVPAINVRAAMAGVANQTTSFACGGGDLMRSTAREFAHQVGAEIKGGIPEPPKKKKSKKP